MSKKLAKDFVDQSDAAVEVRDLIADLMMAIQGFGNKDLRYCVSVVFKKMMGRPPTDAELYLLDVWKAHP